MTGGADPVPAPGCPRCLAEPVPDGQRWHCDEHGEVTPLWRPVEAGYAGFVEQLDASRGYPTLLPWPMGPAWTVTDHARVGGDSGPQRGRTLATLTCCSGPSARDGAVDVLVVVEEAGVGLGARCAGVGEHEPGPGLGERPPAARVRLGHQSVPLWSLSTSGAAAELDRSVLVGESAGRWLWLVLRPASAVLMLREDWVLRDAAELGPLLVEVVFGGARPPW